MKEYLNFKQANCKNCYRCLRECPVKAITVIGDRARIREDLCVLCGHCTSVCSFNAKEVAHDVASVRKLLGGKKPVIASVAPAFAASFAPDFAAFAAALKRLGFAEAYETAEGAKAVTAEYAKLLESGAYKNLIASACPSIVRLIRLYYPDALACLAPVDSPMVAHAKMLRARFGDCKVVFVGPCIAKKREADESGVVDACLTFDELAEMFAAAGISFESAAPLESGESFVAEALARKEPAAQESARKEHAAAGESISREGGEVNAARNYPINHGIIRSFETHNPAYEYISVDGLARAKEVLADVHTLSGMFIEMHACEFSCINGPCALHKAHGGFIKATETVRAYAKRAGEKVSLADVDLKHIYRKIADIRRIPSEGEIRKILAATGKTRPEDELNCGACGYSTCREKAIAVYNGFAEISMCVPYMRERAEGLSYDIIQNTPNGIFAVDESMALVEINDTAAALLGTTKAQAKGEPLEKFYNPADFYRALYENEFVTDRRVQMEKTGKWAEMSIRKVRGQNLLLCILKDVTADEDYRHRLEQIRRETAAAADDVVGKQMRVVQEIASLLGETAAETKIALLRLKETLGEERKDGQS